MWSFVSILLGGFVSSIILLVTLQFLAYQWLKRQNESRNEQAGRLSIDPVLLSKQLSRQVLAETRPYETVDWLNDIVHRIFLDIYQSRTYPTKLMAKLNNELREIEKKQKIVNNLEITDFSFGHYAPNILAANLSKTNELNAFDLNLILHMHYCGQLSMTITGALQTPVGTIHTSVSVKINEITGRLRVQFFHTDQPYCSIGFVEEPTMKYDLSMQIGDKNRNIVEQAFRVVIKNVIQKMIVHPNYKVFPLDPTHDPVSQKKTKRESKPVLVHRITVKVNGASGVAAADANGFSDPYCVVKCMKEVRRTKYLHKTLNPQWRESFMLEVPAESDATLSFRVFDYDKFSKDDFLGMVSLPLSSLPDQEMTSFNEPLAPSPKMPIPTKPIKGMLSFDVKIERDVLPVVGMKRSDTTSLEKPKVSGLVGVEVKHATGLFASDSNGFSDPYCIVTIGSKTRKTKTIKKNLNPYWNQKFVFQVDDDKEEVVFQVYDWDFVGKDDFLGYASVPLAKLSMETVNDFEFNLEKRTEMDHVSGKLYVSIIYKAVEYGLEEQWKNAFFTDTMESSDVKDDDEEYDLVEEFEDAGEGMPPIILESTPNDSNNDGGMESFNGNSIGSNNSFITNKDPTFLPSTRVLNTSNVDKKVIPEDAASTASFRSDSERSGGPEDDRISIGSTASSTKVGVGKSLYLYSGHRFETRKVTKLKSTCAICNKSLTFSSFYKCIICKTRVHKKCHEHVPTCNPAGQHDLHGDTVMTVRLN